MEPHLFTWCYPLSYCRQDFNGLLLNKKCIIKSTVIPHTQLCSRSSLETSWHIHRRALQAPSQFTGRPSQQGLDCHLKTAFNEVSHTNPSIPWRPRLGRPELAGCSSPKLWDLVCPFHGQRVANKKHRSLLVCPYLSSPIQLQQNHFFLFFFPLGRARVAFSWLGTTTKTGQSTKPCLSSRSVRACE